MTREDGQVCRRFGDWARRAGGRGHRALRWAEVEPGETVAVIGCGPVGLLALELAQVRGAGKVIGVDILPCHLQLARETSGAEAITPPRSTLAFVTSGRFKADDIIAHRLPLGRAPPAYGIFSGRRDRCTKVVLDPWA